MAWDMKLLSKLVLDVWYCPVGILNVDYMAIEVGLPVLLRQLEEVRGLSQTEVNCTVVHGRPIQSQ